MNEGEDKTLHRETVLLNTDRTRVGMIAAGAALAGVAVGFVLATVSMKANNAPCVPPAAARAPMAPMAPMAPVPPAPPVVPKPPAGQDACPHGPQWHHRHGHHGPDHSLLHRLGQRSDAEQTGREAGPQPGAIPAAKAPIAKARRGATAGVRPRNGAKRPKAK